MTLMISLPGTYGRPGSTSHGGKTLAWRGAYW